MKALAAGKHVLLEKPSANTAEEARKMFAFAEEKGLVLLEAFHYRYATRISSLARIRAHAVKVPSRDTSREGDHR